MERIRTLKMMVSPCSPTYLIVGPPTSKVLSRLAPPWLEWKPDSNFLSELHKWNIDHKDDKLPAILAKESKPLQAALEFIPSSPFPAKALVKTIVSLIQLGIVSDVSTQCPCHLPTLILIHLENSSGEAGYV